MDPSRTELWGATVVFLSVALLSLQAQVATNDFYTTPAGATFNVSAPGILTNDTAGAGGGTLTALLASGPANGTLTFNTNGSFVYIPTNNFSGVDGFAYRVSNGSQTSSIAVVEIMVLAPGELFYDNFSRPTNGGPSLPWVQLLGTWSITNRVMIGTGQFLNYGYAYYQNKSWTDYSLQAQIRFSTTSAASAGVLGRLNPTNGAHYAVWLYPENSPEVNIAPGNGKAALQLIKYQDWTNYSLIGTNTILTGLGTNWHTLRVTFQGNSFSAYFDGIFVTNKTDIGDIDGNPAYTNGGIGLNLWTLPPTTYTYSVDNVIVGTTTAVANYDAYSTTNNITLRVAAPGILANDFGRTNVTALLVSGPAGGNLILTNNGGFSYTPTNGFMVMDSFTYRCTDSQSTSSVATVTIAVDNTPMVTNDAYTLMANKPLNVAQPGILANDAGGTAPLTVALVNGPTAGNLILTNNGGFTYTPGTNYLGMDSFTYQASDGHTTTSVARVDLMVTTPGGLFYDNFARPAGTNSIFPWVRRLGTWGVTNNQLIGTSPFTNYGYAYYDNPGWTNYSVQAQIRFSTTNGWGGAICGRLNPTNGAHYAVWVFPENSPWGPLNGMPAGVATLQIFKRSTWTNYTAQNLVRLPAVGTNWHTVKLALHGTNIFAYFDGSLVTNLVDNGAFDGSRAYTNGGICIGTWTAFPTTFTTSVRNVEVTPLVVDDYYSLNGGTALTVAAPGVLANDLDSYGTNARATQVTGPAHGILTLNTNGGFTYTPTNNYVGTDSFFYRANDGSIILGTATVTLTINLAHNGPTLSVQTNRMTAELALLAVTNTANYADVPPSPLTYTLIGPTNAAISTNGVITWTPNESQGPSTNTFTTVVSDGAQSATNSFTVTVTEVNVPPTLPIQTNWMTAESVLITITNIASDTDIPANLLAYNLASPTPTNATINNNGVISWTPDEHQGPSTNTFTTVVSDGVLTATNSFVVIVTEVNTTPTLPVQTDRIITELSVLIVTNTAGDTDIPINLLTYTLIGPTNAAISADGVIIWTPDESQGLTTNTFTTVVSDGERSATNSFVVAVTETNTAPSLPSQINLAIAELSLLMVTNSANDTDIPVNSLSYTLSGPTNAAISTNGVITWTPDESQGPGTNTFVTVASDGELSVTNSFEVTVTEANEIPTLPGQTNLTIVELALLAVTNTANDTDIPTNLLTYTLTGPTNATIGADGVIIWTPDESQGPSTNTFVTVVSDGTFSATNGFVVTVVEVNASPTLPIQTNLTTPELSLLTVTNTASDTDIPASPLTYTLIGPTNAAINTGGIITWIPDESQGPGTNTFITVVSDGALSTTNSFVVIATEIHVAPTLPVQTDQTIALSMTLTVTNTANDTDIPANMLTYTLTGPTNAAIGVDGEIVWIPDESQSPSTNNFTTVVSDGVLTATNSFEVTVLGPDFAFAITSLTVTDGLATITWNAIPNRVYRLQYLDSLDATNWNDLLPDVTTTNPTASQTNLLDDAPQQFYRVKLLGQ